MEPLLYMAAGAAFVLAGLFVGLKCNREKPVQMQQPPQEPEPLHPVLEEDLKHAKEMQWQLENMMSYNGRIQAGGKGGIDESQN